MLQSVFTRASQTIQNENSIVNDYNELRKKFGLAHYCLGRYGDMTNQLKQVTASILYKVQPSNELEDLSNSLQAFFLKAHSLETSPEYQYVQKDF